MERYSSRALLISHCLTATSIRKSFGNYPVALFLYFLLLVIYFCHEAFCFSAFGAESCQVYIIEFCWHWTATNVTETFACTVPPLPCSTTSAARLWDCMRSHSLCKPIWRFYTFLISFCRLPLIFACTDDASGNDKLLAHQLQALPTALQQRMPCQNHQVGVHSNN